MALSAMVAPHDSQITQSPPEHAAGRPGRGLYTGASPMIPLRDIIQSRTTPWINLLLIAINTLAFVYELTLPQPALIRFFFRYGLIPAHFSWAAATSSMFLHENVLHIGSNLLCLWIFGDNVEDRMGHLRYLVFYLLAGYVAALTEVWAGPTSAIPLIGASGAIAGVMGAYFVLFPHSRILVLVPLIFIFDVFEVPAVLFLGFWFLLQAIGGAGRLAQPAVSGGVAFWAHVGGFLTGIIAVWVFRRPERQRVEWWNGGR
jgi:membrane associated rhomboid family serine protease